MCPTGRGLEVAAENSSAELSPEMAHAGTHVREDRQQVIEKSPEEEKFRLQEFGGKAETPLSTGPRKLVESVVSIGNIEKIHKGEKKSRRSGRPTTLGRMWYERRGHPGPSTEETQGVWGRKKERNLKKDRRVEKKTVGGFTSYIKLRVGKTGLKKRKRT